MTVDKGRLLRHGAAPGHARGCGHGHGHGRVCGHGRGHADTGNGGSDEGDRLEWSNVDG